MPVSTIETRNDMDDHLADADRTLVMVRTAGCTICKSMAPILDSVARATDIPIIEFNPRDDPDAVAEFDVRSVPTFLLFDDGEVIDRRADGFVPTADLVEFVESSE